MKTDNKASGKPERRGGTRAGAGRPFPQDSRSLRDREIKERGDNWALKNAILRGELLNRSDVMAALEPLFSAIAQIINASALSKKDKDDLLSNIATYPIVVEQVAIKQSALVAALKK
jgi:hypothetical protein